MWMPKQVWWPLPKCMNSGGSRIGSKVRGAGTRRSSIIAEAKAPSDPALQAAIAYQANSKSPPTIWSGDDRQSAARWFDNAKFQQLAPFTIGDRRFFLALR